MTPAFGFSVGDFISAIGLVKRISKALKETGGASSEYQLVVIELKSLENILRHLETLQPAEDNVTQINAIRGMALACQLPLRDFMIKLERYESTLGPFADKRTLRAMAKKSKWAVVFAEEVERLRAMVAAKNISLNLLLAMNTQQSLAHIGVQVEEKHSDLMSKAAEHRAALHKVQEGMVQVEEKVSRAGVACNVRLDSMENKMTQAKEAFDHRFDEIDAKVESTQTSIVNLRSTGEEILRCLGTFPREMRELIQCILHANWQMYQVLLKIQQSTARSPTGLLESNIRFEDALGDYRELPYEYFCHWEPFEGFLRVQFKGKLGERKVLEGQYHIIDIGNDRRIVKKEHWASSIEQGVTLTMSMVMSHLQKGAKSCPRPSCPGGEVKECPTSGSLSCKLCNLKFYPKSNVEDSFHSMEEEEEVALRQNEEDLRLYGSRPEPADPLEVDLDTKPPMSPTEDNTRELNIAFDHVEAVHKTGGTSDYSEDSVYRERNSEVNPLSTWLTQSALPSVMPMFSHPLDQTACTKVDLVKEEVEEIERFRNVHIAWDLENGGPKNDSPTTDPTRAEGALHLELPSQIYYRNIVDRYPLLPTYLARRLAEANSRRAERLSRQRVKEKAKCEVETLSLDSHDLSDLHEQLWTSSVCSGSALGKEAQKTPRELHVHPGTQTKKKSASRSKTKMPNYPTFIGAPTYSQKLVKADKKPVNSSATLYQSQPQSDYWNGGSLHSRTESVGSGSSSRNSSLHGSPKFCYQKQYQNMDYLASQPKYHQSSSSLPPPPIKLGNKQPSKRKTKKLSFDCDICGENVEVDRRRQWQKHVIKDLRPYVCTARDCSRSMVSFPSLHSYLNHEIIAHELYPSERSSARAYIRRKEESIQCVFCGERTEAGKGPNARERHVGHHMEEISFAAVPKAYKEWEFYSESSSGKSDSYKQTKAAVHKRNAALTDPDKQLVGEAGKVPRNATAQDANFHAIPAGYSLRHWDPEERPIFLLGSVFDANSLGKWIYDWTVFCHGVHTPMCDLATELWLLLIKLAGMMKRIEERPSYLMSTDEEELLEDFFSKAEVLWRRLKKLLLACEGYMWKSAKKDCEKKMGNESGREFVNTMFGHDRRLETTEALMQAIRLWTMRFDANCGEILNAAESSTRRNGIKKWEGFHGEGASINEVPEFPATLT